MHVNLKNFTSKTCTFFYKSFVENIKFKLKRPTMSCKFKTGQRPVSKFISCMVYSDTGSWKHTGCYHNHPLHSVTTGICVSVRKTIEND